MPADADANNHKDETGPADNDGPGWPNSPRPSSRATHSDTDWTTDGWSIGNRFSGLNPGTLGNGGAETDTVAGPSTASGNVANLDGGFGEYSSLVPAATADRFTPHNWNSHFANPQSAGEVLEQSQMGDVKPNDSLTEEERLVQAFAFEEREFQLFDEEERLFQAMRSQENTSLRNEASEEVDGVRVRPRGHFNPPPQLSTNPADDRNNETDAGLSGPSRLATQVLSRENDDERPGRLSPSQAAPRAQESIDAGENGPNQLNDGEDGEPGPSRFSVPWSPKYTWQKKTPKPHEWWKF